MWKCANCGEEHEEQFDSCWKCFAKRNPEEAAPEASGDDSAVFESEAWPPRRETPPPPERDPFKFCPRCGLPLELYGYDRLRQGPDGWGAINNPAMEAWKCPRCKRLEFYAPEE